MTTISIDAMGGDHGLSTTVPAALAVLAKHRDANLILVGEQTGIQQEIARQPRNESSASRLRVVNANEVVGMNESPAAALRKKKNSSMRVAIDLVQDGSADACISAGNTGALLATARFVLKTIPGISRPAICTALPRIGGRVTYMLDLGANVDIPAEILFQFGLMGSVLIRCVHGNATPTVGLLNIGVEEVKGNETIKAAGELFKQSALNYIGYVEGDGIFTGEADLVVCDGFAGNVALKASEGVAQMIAATIREEFFRSPTTRVAGLLAKPVLNAIKQRFDHRRYNGASLLGLRGTVVKSHGGTDVTGFQCAVETAIHEARAGLVHRIESALAETRDGKTGAEKESVSRKPH